MFLSLAVLILLVFGFVLFVLHGFAWARPAVYNLQSIGLACWVLAILVMTAAGMATGSGGLK